MKTQFRSLSPILLLSALAPLNLHAADKHVHGEADLFVAIEKNQVLIELESPTDNIIGFEHEPRTASQKAAVKKGMAILQDASSLIKITEGNCKQSDAFVESPFAESEKHEGHHDHGHDDHGHEKEHAHKDEHHHEKEHKHEEHHHAEEHKHEKHGHDHHDHHDHGDDKDAHSEFHATYTLDCKNTDAIKSAIITAFASFQNIEKITVNWVTSKGQGSEKATAKKTKVSFK